MLPPPRFWLSAGHPQKREVAHPQLVWSTLKNILALCFPVKVTHPRVNALRVEVWGGLAI